MSRATVIQVPYHLGHEGVGMGAGPDALVEAGLANALSHAGHRVAVRRIARHDDAANEIGAAFAVLREVAAAAREAKAEGAFPLALAANCMTSVAVVAGMGEDVGVVWLDAHPDFNTAEGTTSGFADGMGLSILTGTGWDALRETIPGYRSVPEERVVLVGIRDIEPPERERLQASPLQVVPPERLETLEDSLDRLGERVSSVYLHLDLDVLDPSEARANEYSAGGGLTVDDVQRLLAAVAERFTIRAASITAYNPDVDPERRMPPIAISLATAIVEAGVRVQERVA